MRQFYLASIDSSPPLKARRWILPRLGGCRQTLCTREALFKYIKYHKWILFEPSHSEINVWITSGNNSDDDVVYARHACRESEMERGRIKDRGAAFGFCATRWRSKERSAFRFRERRTEPSSFPFRENPLPLDSVPQEPRTSTLSEHTINKNFQPV